MDDTLIIARIKEGDSSELGQLYLNHQNEFCLWLVKHYGSNMGDAREVFQETIIAFYENVKNDRLNELSSSLKTYLFSIGKNKYLSHTRKNNRFVNGENQLPIVPDENNLPEVITRDKTLTAIEESLSKLSEHCRHLIKLYYYDKLSMEQIMERLDYKNANTAKNQKYKCMQQLRKLHNQKAS